ncbi:MAG: TMEM43 family protein [Pirellulaceae bacterium]|nr:TMEM43 family protein [Pirellulaceae bacterium]
MSRDRKNKIGGVVFGVGLIAFSMTALWKNETRYNYYRSAKTTTPIDSIGTAAPGTLFSYTGNPDQNLTIEGDYIQQFAGYLIVWRSAEIYSWVENEDEDGNSTYSRGWHSSIDSNSRNAGIRQVLKNQTLKPSEYRIDDLSIVSKQIEFVESPIRIPLGNFSIGSKGSKMGLSKRGDFLYDSPSHVEKIGDERVSYRGITVPSVATYFGKYDSGKGIAETKNMRTGWISRMIKDSGILHHLVAGDRAMALKSMKRHMNRLKWMIRGIGMATVCWGFASFFSVFARLFFNLPFVGHLAEKGAIVMGILLGIPVALLTIASAYLVAHPLILITFLCLVVGSIYKVRKQQIAQQLAIKSKVDREFGTTLSDLDMKEKQFIELVQIARSDSDLAISETKFLYQWGKKHKWSRGKCDELMKKATSHRSVGVENQRTEEHLLQLIKLITADGSVTAHEMHSVRYIAAKAGYDRAGIQKIIKHVQKLAATSN